MTKEALMTLRVCELIGKCGNLNDAITQHAKEIDVDPGLLAKIIQKELGLSDRNED